MLAVAQPACSHFMHSLSLGPTGSLHITLQFHFADTGSPKQGKTKLASHMRSDDGGESWSSEGEPCQLPVTLESARPFASCLDDAEASILIGTAAKGAGRGWYHSANELHHIAIAADGTVAGHAQLTADDTLATEVWLSRL